MLLLRGINVHIHTEVLMQHHGRHFTLLMLVNQQSMLTVSLGTIREKGTRLFIQEKYKKSHKPFHSGS